MIPEGRQNDPNWPESSSAGLLVLARAKDDHEEMGEFVSKRSDETLSLFLSPPVPLRRSVGAVAIHTG